MMKAGDVPLCFWLVSLLAAPFCLAGVLSVRDAADPQCVLTFVPENSAVQVIIPPSGKPVSQPASAFLTVGAFKSLVSIGIGMYTIQVSPTSRGRMKANVLVHWFLRQHYQSHSDALSDQRDYDEPIHAR